MIAAAAVTPEQVDPRASAALQTLKDSNPLTLTSHGHSQLATQWQDPLTTHASESQAPCLAILRCQEAFLSVEHEGPVLTTKPSHGSVPAASSKSRDQLLH
jgi:hypothetical protein